MENKKDSLIFFKSEKKVVENTLIIMELKEKNYSYFPFFFNFLSFPKFERII